MRDDLDRNHVQYQRDEPDDVEYMIEGLVEIYEVMLRDFIVYDVPENAGTPERVHERFAKLSEDQRQAILDFFEMQPRLRDNRVKAAGGELDRVQAPRNDEALAIAQKVALEGKLAAAREFRLRLADPMSMWGQFATAPAAVPTFPAVAMSAAPAIPEIAARLLEKSYGAKPLRLITRADIAVLNDHFSRLPFNHHKSSLHIPMTLEEICQEAAANLTDGKLSVDKIGLGAPTTNRHFGFLKELIGWFRKQAPGTEAIDWEDFIYEDNRDARQQRDAYSEQEGRALFRLPIWIGAQSAARRMAPGTEVYHDSAYWVPVIAWYTGARREEICQLTLADVGQEEGIWHFTITDENGGRIKNLASKRDIPFAEELIRLGLPAYVTALRGAGETMLFPELRTEQGNRTYGDVYYKNSWLKVAKQLDFIEPGQAIHSFRHTVTTELKSQEVFLETRADLIGHTTPGETAARYSKATRLAILQKAVDKIPNESHADQVAASRQEGAPSVPEPSTGGVSEC